MTTDHIAEYPNEIEPDLINARRIGAIDPAFPDLLFPDQALGDVARSDRRRPGRSEYVSPVLIDLLRHRPDTDMFPIEGENTTNPLGAARGILIGAIVGAACWILIGGLVIAMIR